MNLRLSELKALVLEKRGVSGVRAAAAEVGISTATFSRIENGNMPDLETFGKVCEWLGRDPAEFLGLQSERTELSTAAVHFKKDKTIDQKTATSLAKAIVAAQAALRAKAALKA
jgi:transcriptional regulator with XRE-family HTH domain